MGLVVRVVLGVREWGRILRPLVEGDSEWEEDSEVVVVVAVEAGFHPLHQEDQEARALRLRQAVHLHQGDLEDRCLQLPCSER